MRNQLGVALCAGAASALLFAVSAKGTLAAALIAYFTALPIMIAALAFGHVAALGGAVLGSGAIAVGLGPVMATFYGLCFALPAWWLGYLGLLARPLAGDGRAAAQAASTVAWYPVQRLVTWAIALAILAVLLLGLLVLWRYGTFEAATAALTRRLDAAVEDHPDTADAAVFFIRLMPPLMAASLVLMHCVNLWFAARIARVSDRLRRPWPNVPDGVKLPKAAAGLLVLSLAPALLDGAAGAGASAVAAALALAFALQGLACAHVLTRGFAGRGMLLALIYIVTLALPVAVLALCLIGVVDCLFALRNRQPPSPPKQKPTGA